MTWCCLSCVNVNANAEQSCASCGRPRPGGDPPSRGVLGLALLLAALGAATWIGGTFFACWLALQVVR